MVVGTSMLAMTRALGENPCPSLTRPASCPTPKCDSQAAQELCLLWKRFACRHCCIIALLIFVAALHFCHKIQCYDIVPNLEPCAGDPSFKEGDTPVVEAVRSLPR